MAHPRLSSANQNQFRAAILAPALQVFMFVVASGVAVFGQDASTGAPTQDDGLLSMVFSAYGILVIVAVVGLIVVRRIHGKREGRWEDVEDETAKPAPLPSEILPAARNQMKRSDDQTA